MTPPDIDDVDDDDDEDGDIVSLTERDDTLEVKHISQ